MTEQDLLNLKKDIDEAKKEILQLEGQKKALMTQLKEDWDCTTLEQAEKKLKGMQRKLTTFNEEIEQGLEEIKEKYAL